MCCFPGQKGFGAQAWVQMSNARSIASTSLGSTAAVCNTVLSNPTQQWCAAADLLLLLGVHAGWVLKLSVSQAAGYCQGV
jgi:hypothetical protein